MKEQQKYEFEKFRNYVSREKRKESLKNLSHLKQETEKDCGHTNYYRKNSYPIEIITKTQ